MSLQSLSGIGYGGAAGNRLNKILQELQSFKQEVLAGAAADAVIAVSGMEHDDTILSAIMFDTGVPSDVLSEVVMVDRRASGTLTLSGVVAGDVVEVNGYDYTAATFTHTLTNGGGLPARSFAVGDDDTATAANLAAAINANEGSVVTASSDAAVVTIRAVAKGTDGNAITLDDSGSNSHVTESGATLAGGTATGGFSLDTTNSTGNTLLITWMKKPAAVV